MAYTSFNKEFIVTDESVIKDLMSGGFETCYNIDDKLDKVDLKILQKRALDAANRKNKCDGSLVTDDYEPVIGDGQG